MTPAWEATVHLRLASAGVDPASLVPGRDLVLDLPRAQGDRLPMGVLLDDVLSTEARAAIDREAMASLSEWRDRRDGDLTVDGVCLSQIWEVELLAEVFLPETRVISGLSAAFHGSRLGRLEIADLDAERAICLGAVLGSDGIEVAPPSRPGEPPRYPSTVASPGRTPLSRRVARPIFHTIGVPPRVRGEVFIVDYWHLRPVFERLAAGTGPQPVLDPGFLQPSSLRTLIRSARRGGWVAHPNALDRRRSGRLLAAALAAARATAATPESLSGLLDLRALVFLERVAGESLALVRRMGRAFRSKSLELVVLPFDSPPHARSIVQAARDAGVRTLVVQHGFNAEPNDPDKSLADAVAVWSELDRRTVRRRTTASVTVTGNPGVENLVERALAAAPRTVSDHTIVLVEYPSRLSTRFDNRVSLVQVTTALRALAEARPGTPVTIRPHPAEREPEIFAQAASRHPEIHVGIDTQSSIDELIGSADLLIGAISTATLQAGVAGVPVIFLNVTGFTAPWPFDGSTDVPIASSAEELLALIPPLLSSGLVPGRPEMREALGVDPQAMENVIDLISVLAKPH